MKRVVAASAGLIALVAGGTVGAAELPRKAAKPVYKAEPAPVIALPNWTGFYFGGNIGSSIGRHRSNVTALSGEGIDVDTGTPLYDGPRDFMLSPDGINVGLQAGYNWQFAPQWLVGIEADFQVSAARDDTNCVLPCGAPMAFVRGFLGGFFPVTLNQNSVDSKLDWFGTVRGRVAYANGPALFYATGGFAYGRVTTRSFVSGSTSFFDLFDDFEFEPENTFEGSFKGSKVKTGWTAGWGIEAQLGGNWSVKKEYLYIDLGTVSNTFNTVFTSGGSVGDVAAMRTVTSDIRQHVFRTGLNYKFGGPDAPVAFYNWTGFYIGANGGYGVGAHSTDVLAIAGPDTSADEGDVLYGGLREFTLSPAGWNGGGQIGYNWHVTPQWVVGVEADLQAGGGRDRVNCMLPCNLPIALTSDFLPMLLPVRFSEVSTESELNWFGTVRGRVGRASGPAFFYFTGGLAYGEVSTRARVEGTTTFLGFGSFSDFAGSLDTSKTKLGWTLGSGLEAQVAGNWTLKTEYLYVDLGKVENTFSTFFDDGDLAATRTITTEIKEHIFRAGLNYKFSDFGKAPVVTKY